MNLKKSVLSLFAATAIVASLFAPVAADDDPITSTERTRITVGEGGDLTMAFGYSPGFEYPSVNVTTTTSAWSMRDDGYPYISISVDDQQSKSNGWKLTLTSTNLVNLQGSIIPADSVHIGQGRFWFPDSCPVQTEMAGNPASHPLNDFQVISVQPTHDPVPVGTSGLQVAQATPGRGCGDALPTYGTSLFVHAGTDTQNSESLYSGRITATLDPSGL